MSERRRQGGDVGPARAVGSLRLRRGLLVAIGVVYVVSVPWYRDPEPGLVLFFGLPDWVAVAVLCYGVVACLNAVAWWHTEIDDAGPLPDALAGAGSSEPGPGRTDEPGGAP